MITEAGPFSITARMARSLRAEPSWRSRAESLIERFGLSAARNVVGAELSKGTRQKTLIAASVLAAMPVYLFDEPMVGLDMAAQREIRLILRELLTQAVVIVSTHQLEVVVRECSRVLMLVGGRIVEDVGLRGASSVSGNLSSVLEETYLRVTA